GVRIVAIETAYPRLDIASQAETDKNGLYRLENLPAGDYFIVADPLKIPSYFPGTGSRDESTPVSVKAGDVINGRDFRFVRNSGILGTTRTRSSGESRLSGVVRDTQGRGIPNFTVKLSGFDKDDRRWTVT